MGAVAEVGAPANQVDHARLEGGLLPDCSDRVGLGTSISTGLTSVNTVLGRVPLRAFPVSAGPCLSWQRCSVISACSTFFVRTAGDLTRARQAHARSRASRRSVRSRRYHRVLKASAPRGCRAPRNIVRNGTNVRVQKLCQSSS